MSSHNAVIDQLARAIGQRLPRRTLIRSAAAALLGGAMVDGVAPASAARRRVCRPDGGGCARDAQCCTGACATDRSLPRSRRNRCCETCGGSVCVNTMSSFENCQECGNACPADMADSCVDGNCMCGAESACDSLIADACVSGACLCGDQPACAPNTELCNNGTCITGDCTLASDARMCIVDPEQNVYQLSVAGGLGLSGRCTSTSDCLDFLPQCGSTATCVCAAFARFDNGGVMYSFGGCGAISNQWLIV